MEDHDKTIYEQVRDEQLHYEQHPDADEWEVVPAPKEAEEPKSFKRTMISARFSQAEAEEIRVAASQEGKTISAFVRASALERARFVATRGQLSLATASSVGVRSNVISPVNYSDRQLSTASLGLPEFVSS
jgi:hypothetical protein